MKKNLLQIISIITVIFFLSCASSNKQKRADEFSFGEGSGTGTVTETAEGIGEVRAAGVDEAYDRAREDALKKCVEQALGTIIDARILGDSGVIIEENIYAKKQGYIKKYDIISKRIEDGVAYMKVRAVVGLEKLKDDVMALDILQDRMNLPKVLIFIKEKNLGQDSRQNAAYNVMVQKFTEKKFTIVSPTEISDNYKNLINKLYLSMDTDENSFIATAAKLGLEGGSDIVIVGKTTSEKAENALSEYNTKMQSFQADVEFKVVNIGDGRIMALTSKHAAAVHLTDVSGGISAIQRATEPAADDLINQILKAWDDILNNGNLINLNVSGLSLTEEIKFQKALKSYFREVKEVYPKQKKGDYSLYTVKYLGVSRDLANALVTKETFPYKVDVIKYDFGQVTIKALNK